MLNILLFVWWSTGCFGNFRPGNRGISHLPSLVALQVLFREAVRQIRVKDLREEGTYWGTPHAVKVRAGVNEVGQARAPAPSQMLASSLPVLLPPVARSGLVPECTVGWSPPYERNHVVAIQIEEMKDKRGKASHGLRLAMKRMKGALLR
ncbi:hypothetical protein DFH06DRAFT_1140043 [Mycena polygramma]|nr:hypothetical protein DFH06DRAFT_1140043 [Mycena polygramma]